MSKIQKALGRLRSGAGGEGSGTQGGPGDAQVDGTPRHGRDDTERMRQLSRGPVRRYADASADSKKVPGCRIQANVTREMLIEHGLQSSVNDEELIAQQFRRVKRPILNLAFGAQSLNQHNANVIMITSALPKSGKTFCSFNLAMSIARERDLGAVLVDADVLKPNISRAFGVADRPGLVDYLLDPNLTVDDLLVGTNVGDLIIVPAGRRHDETNELLASRRMEDFVHEMALKFRSSAILVDTPPLLLTNEAHVLADHMGQIVIIVEAGVTSLEALNHTVELLNRDKPINVVMNKARGDHRSAYSGGVYGYGYGYAAPADEE